MSFTHITEHNLNSQYRQEIVRYSVTGVSEFAKEMEEKGLNKPKVSLQFELSTSGITSLIKAEAAVEEIVIVEEEVEVDDDDEEEVADADADAETEKVDEKKESEVSTEEKTEDTETEKEDAEVIEEKPKKKKTKKVEKVNILQVFEFTPQSSSSYSLTLVKFEGKEKGS